ncbi:hypothetical protein ACJ73_01436 [Blastomyces percursus]|uniref:Uncharacterized protein n=1 Tax=Blastomyces percursus TaxID=1658174 RepID=A0A1J9RHQ9_9EURO|nr:hypothetical protein ACJ73_01436 [Blastomyces percursus]
MKQHTAAIMELNAEAESYRKELEQQLPAETSNTVLIFGGNIEKKVWRISTKRHIPNPLYIIPIRTISGEPQIHENDNITLLVPGKYVKTETKLDIEPELECVFAGHNTSNETS